MSTRKFYIKNVIIAILILLQFGIIKSSFTQEIIILKGTIEVIKMFDEEEIDYAVLKVISSVTDDEGKISTSIEEYPIEDNAVGKRLYKLDGETVEVTGSIFEDNYGPVWLSVKSFKVIKQEEDENEKPVEP
jgi:hypothetical protein